MAQLVSPLFAQGDLDGFTRFGCELESLLLEQTGLVRPPQRFPQEMKLLAIPAAPTTKEQVQSESQEDVRGQALVHGAGLQAGHVPTGGEQRPYRSES
jgi:hypothetical protein